MHDGAGSSTLKYKLKSSRHCVRHCVTILYVYLYSQITSTSNYFVLYLHVGKRQAHFVHSSTFTLVVISTTVELDVAFDKELVTGFAIDIIRIKSRSTFRSFSFNAAT